MTDWEKVHNLTCSMKGFCLPPPRPSETAFDYWKHILGGFGNFSHALAGIHAIAYKNVHEQNNPPPDNQEKTITQSNEDEAITKKGENNACKL